MVYKTTGLVEKRIWDFDDTYLTVSVQVPEEQFKSGDAVRVTVEKEEQ